MYFSDPVISPLKRVFTNDKSPIRVKILSPKYAKLNKARLNFTLQDETAIRKGIAWGENADNFRGALEDKKIYTINNYVAKKPSSSRYNPDPIEFTFNEHTEITLQDDDPAFLERPIETIVQVLQHRELSCIIVSITNVGHLEETPKVRRPMRKIKILDVSCRETLLVTFDSMATNFDDDFEINDTIKVSNV